MLPKCERMTNSRTFGTCGKSARFYTIETWFDDVRRLIPICTGHKKFSLYIPGNTEDMFFRACHLCGLPLPDEKLKTEFPNQEFCKCYWCGYHHRSERLPCAND